MPTDKTVDQRIEERAREYADSNGFMSDEWHAAKATYIAGAESRQPEIDQLREAMQELLTSIEGLPPLKAIEGALEKQYNKCKQLIPR